MSEVVNLGKVSMTAEGNYDPSRSYDKLAVVVYNGLSWVSRKKVPEGVAPSEANSAFWQKISDRGVQGATGAPGQSYVDKELVPIVNDLTTGGSANVLSAEQGKVLKGELAELSESTKNTESLLFVNTETISLIMEGDGDKMYITSGNVWSPGGRTYMYPVLRGDRVTLTANSSRNTIFALLSSTDNTDAQIPCFLFGWYGRKVLSPNEKTTIDIPADCYLYIYGKDSSSNVYFPSVAEIHRMPKNAIDKIEDSVEAVNLHVNKTTYEVVVSREDMMSNIGYIASSFAYGESGKHRIYPVKQGDVITITSQTSTASFVALIDSCELAFAWSFVGDAARYRVLGQSTLIAPKDCYLYIYESDASGKDYFPKAISIVSHSDSILESYTLANKLSNIVTTILSPLGEVAELSRINADALINHYVNGSNVWQGQGDAAAALFFVKKGSKVSLTAYSAMKTIYTLLTTADLDFNQAVPFVGGWKRTELPAGESTIINIPQDCYLYVYYKTSGNVRYFPASAIYNNITSDDSNNSIERELTYQDACAFLRKGIGSNRLWAAQSKNTLSSVVFEVSKGDVISITANNDYPAFYALLNDVGGQHGTIPNFIAGETERHTIEAKHTETFTIPEDCLLYVYRQADTGDIVYYPSRITIKEANMPTLQTAKRTRFAVNLLRKEDVMLASTIDSNGNVIENLEYKCTPLIALRTGVEWYQKVKYVHCCSLNEEGYAFRAIKAAFYDNLQSLISVVENATSAIEMPDNAEFVRVVFDITDDLMYVATDNRSVIQPYRECSTQDWVKNPNNVYDSISNSDGAISQMIYTALTLMSRSNLGYGDIATAFDNVVEPVPSEFEPIKYEGEKMQINCSTFAQMCLLGITYDNSRYANPLGRNIGTLYQYDSMAEFNYRYTKDEFAHIEGADYQKMYANKMAKYAYDRGLLYHVKPDYSNIEVGDLLFNTANYKPGNEYNFFWSIGHVSLVSEVLLNADGSKTVIVMENGTSESEWSYGSAGVVGARFPLPNIPIDTTNVAQGFSPYNGNVSLLAGETKLIATVNVDVPFKRNTLFTAVVDAEIPEGCDIVVYVDGKRKSKVNFSAYRRGDKLFIKHFHFYQNDAVNSNEMSVGVVSQNGVANAFVAINDIKLYKGYHSKV